MFPSTIPRSCNLNRVNGVTCAFKRNQGYRAANKKVGGKMTETLVSIQVGKPEIHDVGTRKAWESAIFKSDVRTPIWLAKLNLAGDAQQDLRVHGGPFRAVLSYSADYYPTWRETL